MTNSDTAAVSGLAVARTGPVTWLTIDRPLKRNAISHAMWRAIPGLIAAFDADETARVLVLQGRDRDFSVGADISEFGEMRSNSEAARVYESANSSAYAAVRSAAKPTIAAIAGNCLGGGFGLAAACDLRLAAPDAVFAVRSFTPIDGIAEDPVCGSGNAAIAAFLQAGNALPARDYAVSQGREVGREGRVAVHIDDDGAIEIEGRTLTRIDGVIRLD